MERMEENRMARRVFELVQAGAELCSFCNDTVNSIKHFMMECEDLISVRNLKVILVGMFSS